MSTWTEVIQLNKQTNKKPKMQMADWHKRVLFDIDAAKFNRTELGWLRVWSMEVWIIEEHFT